MVGAQLDGFDTMVNLTHTNEFMVLEGDEYLSSPIDRRPKFHLYKPNIALISGIAWDHINVFPTYENYVDQFSIFADSLANGGIMVYNEEDAEVKNVIENSNHHFKQYPYKTPSFKIEEGVTFVETSIGDVPLEIFGKHNLQNMAGAQWICSHMGIGEEEFYEAIVTFTGANKRLEIIKETANNVAFKDFAHSPSKVKATMEAVKEQYTSKHVLACFELHTYSSLNADFLKEYNGALDAADEAVVFYSPKAVAIKQLEEVSEVQIKEAFGRQDLIVFTDPSKFQQFLFAKQFKNVALLLMSSGNYGGLNFEDVGNLL